MSILGNEADMIGAGVAKFTDVARRRARRRSQLYARLLSSKCERQSLAALTVAGGWRWRARSKPAGRANAISSLSLDPHHDGRLHLAPLTFCSPPESVCLYAARRWTEWFRREVGRSSSRIRTRRAKSVLSVAVLCYQDTTARSSSRNVGSAMRVRVSPL